MGSFTQVSKRVSFLSKDPIHLQAFPQPSTAVELITYSNPELSREEILRYTRILLPSLDARIAALEIPQESGGD